MFEKYLTHVSNDSDRSNLARFRTSCHKLLIEYGRYTTPKTPIAERLCKQCVMNAVEDESHFLLVCPKYANHRIKITNHLNNNTNFASQSYMSKFQWLLSNEDKSVCKDIASFVTICFSLRNWWFCFYCFADCKATYLPFMHRRIIIIYIDKKEFGCLQWITRLI